ncbi:MAG TPA: hypothetical protein VM469_12720 [Pseudoxanthomonas sp.]|jgi:hypothetical protein|nr:hypothetical protein [Pseudoxanthomonas sp.]
MLMFSEAQIKNCLSRLEATDARAIGQLEALTVWLAAIVQTHPDGEQLRTVAHKLSSRNPFRSACSFQEEVAAYDAVFCQFSALSDGKLPAVPVELERRRPPRV